MRGICCVRLEEEGCSRQGESGQRTTGNQSPSVAILHWKEFFFSLCLSPPPPIITGTERVKQREFQVWWQGTIKETENNGGYLEKYPFLTGSQWSFFLRSLICSWARQQMWTHVMSPLFPMDNWTKREREREGPRFSILPWCNFQFYTQHAQ